MRALTLALVLVASSALGQTIKCVDQPNLACAKTPGAVGVIPRTCVGGTPVVGSVDANGNIGCIAGGSGSGAPNLLPVDTLSVITANQASLFMASGTGIDTSELNVQQRVKNATTF